MAGGKQRHELIFLLQITDADLTRKISETFMAGGAQELAQIPVTPRQGSVNNYLTIAAPHVATWR